MSDGARLLAVLLLFAALPSSALEPSRRVTQYMRDGLRREDGLPQSSVQAIVQTRDGYLWFATEQGLARYDGARLTAFGRWNTPELGGNDIQSLFEDRAGTLWIGSHGGGLMRYRDGRFTRMPGKLASGIIWSIAEDSAGTMWVATEESGVARLRGRTTDFLTSKNGLPDDTAYALLAARDGSMWVGTRGGLTRIRAASIASYTTREGLPANSVKTLYEDRSGAIWLGTRGGGAARFKDGAFTPLGTREGLPNLDVFAILEDRDRNLWIATGGAGLVRLTAGRTAVFGSGDGLANDTVLALLEDAEGSLWIGTDGGGVTRLRDAKFVTYGQADGLSHDVAMSVCEDVHGAVWVGTLGGGVNRIAGADVRAYTTRDGLSNDMVFAVSGDRSGAVWVGTRDGLNRIQDGRITIYRKKDGLPSSAVSAIYQDRRGDLWFGTPDGVSRLHGGTFTTWTTRDGLPANFTLAITEDHGGNIWLGTAGGLCRFDGRTFTTMTSRDGLADDLIMGLNEDDDGVLWIATRKGLSRLADGKVTSYTREDGMTDDLILATLDDHHGDLWVSSNNGVFRLHKDELAKLAAKRTKLLHPIAYGIEDGLRSNECNGGVQPAAWRSADGRLWFPTVKGVASIDPSHIRVNRRPPPTRIQQVIVDEHAVPIGDVVRLPAGTHRLELQYAGLSFLAPERVHFLYRLEGFDRDWIDAGPRRSAVYTNLGPGQYRFLLRAANSDGVWTESPATLRVEQLPFFHQTYAFFALCAIGAALLLWAFFRWRVMRMELAFSAVLAERARIAREFHDTIAQGLTGVRLQLGLAADAMESDPAFSQRALQKAESMTRDNLREVRRALADLRAEVLEGDDLGVALQKFAVQATNGGSVVPRVLVRGEPRRLHAPIENDLLRIGQEAITNALLHANATHIDVELTFRRRRVTLRVRDDGVGSDPHLAENLARARYGVAGMRERAGLMGAQFAIRSRPAEGTEVTVDVRA